MDDKKLEQQLKRAYELRNFEISHYWKRGQYFWGFLAVIYTGFFATLIAFSKGNDFAVEYVLLVVYFLMLGILLIEVVKDGKNIGKM